MWMSASQTQSNNQHRNASFLIWWRTVRLTHTHASLTIIVCTFHRVCETINKWRSDYEHDAQMLFWCHFEKWNQWEPWQTRQQECSTQIKPHELWNYVFRQLHHLNETDEKTVYEWSATIHVKLLRRFAGLCISVSNLRYEFDCSQQIWGVHTEICKWKEIRTHICETMCWLITVKANTSFQVSICMLLLVL